jgi:hypothetical protein
MMEIVLYVGVCGVVCICLPVVLSLVLSPGRSPGYDRVGIQVGACTPHRGRALTGAYLPEQAEVQTIAPVEEQPYWILSDVARHPVDR